MTDIDLTEAVEAVDVLAWSHLEFGEMLHIEEILATALPHIIAQVEARVRADVLDWAAEHLSDGLKYEDIEQINSWEAVTVCAGVLRKKAQETRGGAQ